MIPLIVIKYPPDFDGELHIKVQESKLGQAFTYEFTHTNLEQGKSLTEWEVLVKAAQAILNQDKRYKHKIA